VKVRGEANFY